MIFSKRYVTDNALSPKTLPGHTPIIAPFPLSSLKRQKKSWLCCKKTPLSFAHSQYLNNIDQRFRKSPFSLSTTLDSIFKCKLCVSNENNGRFRSLLCGRYGKTHQKVFAFKRNVKRLLWRKLGKQPQLLLHRHSTENVFFFIAVEPLFSGHL